MAESEPKSEGVVKRYELDALAAIFTADREAASKERALDRAQASKDSQEIKELLKENNRIMRETVAEMKADFLVQIGDVKTDVKENYVQNDSLTIQLQPHETIRKFFWWVAGGVGVLLLATLYQLVINGIKSL